MMSALHVAFVQHAQISKIKTFKANTIWTHYDLTIILFLIDRAIFLKDTVTQ